MWPWIVGQVGKDRQEKSGGQILVQIVKNSKAIAFEFLAKREAARARKTLSVEQLH